MLSAIRSLARSPLIGGIIIAFLIAAFALWGVEDILRGGRTDAITVGTERVTPQQLNRAFNQRLSMAQMENPRLTREEADRAGLGESVVSQLAAEAALNAQARELNLGVSDSRVFSEIQDIPAFRSGFSNRFDRATYNEILRQQNWTPETFEQQIRTELRRMQMVDSAIAGARAPSVMAEARAAYEAEARTIRTLLLPPSLAGEIEPPADDILEGFIAEEAQVFQRPEQRRFSIVRAAPDLLAMDADVDEEELRELYQLRLDQGELSEPATRSFALWTVADSDTADALIARIEAGEDADAAAFELGPGRAPDRGPGLRSARPDRLGRRVRDGRGRSPRARHPAGPARRPRGGCHRSRRAQL
jgi:peptidyl-prolyl cis-trans isomerase D